MPLLRRWRPSKGIHYDQGKVGCEIVGFQTSEAEIQGPSVVSIVERVMMPEITLKYGEVVCLKNPDGSEAAKIQLVDEEKYGTFLIVEPCSAAIPTKFRITDRSRR